MARLTTKFVENVKPRHERVEIPDGGTGLYLILQSSGHRSWALRYRHAGRPAKLTIGSWPAVSLLDARKAAIDAQRELGRGHDPAAARKTAKVKAMEAAANTVASVCAAYMKREAGKLRTADQRESVFRRLIYPAIGDRPIDSVRRSDIVAMLDKIEDANGPRMADVALATLRRVFHWHETRTDDFRSPIIRGMGSRQNPVEHRRDRVLNDDELRSLWTATADGGPFAVLIRFLLLTSARRAEAAEMKWSEVDANGTWTLPASRSKTKVEVVRPLSKAALALLEGLPRIEGCDYPFTTSGVSPIKSFSEPKDRLATASGIKDWRLHDLRRTARSLLSRAGVPTDHAERCLGHSLGGIRSIYDRHRYIDEMRFAFEALSAQVETIVNQTRPEGAVIPLSTRRR
jgi:integrase